MVLVGVVGGSSGGSGGAVSAGGGGGLRLLYLRCLLSCSQSRVCTRLIRQGEVLLETGSHFGNGTARRKVAQGGFAPSTTSD